MKPSGFHPPNQRNLLCKEVGLKISNDRTGGNVMNRNGKSTMHLVPNTSNTRLSGTHRRMLGSHAWGTLHPALEGGLTINWLQDRTAKGDGLQNVKSRHFIDDVICIWKTSTSSDSGIDLNVWRGTSQFLTLRLVMSCSFFLSFFFLSRASIKCVSNTYRHFWSVCEMPSLFLWFVKASPLGSPARTSEETEMHAGAVERPTANTVSCRNGGTCDTHKPKPTSSFHSGLH